MSGKCMNARWKSAPSRWTPRASSKVRDAFHKRHKELYTYAEPGSTVEVVNIESTLYGVVDKPDRMTIGAGASPATRR
jgi:N-methylhydantoinase A